MEARDPARPLELGETIQDVARACAENFVSFATIAALVVLPTTAVGVAIEVVLHPVMQELAVGRVDGVFEMLTWIIPAYFVFAIVAAAAYSVAQAAVMYATVEHMVGRKATLIDSLRLGLSRILPLFVCSFLVGIVITTGFFLCCAPGVVAFVWLLAALPVCAVERLGPIDAMQRSLELTEGHRVTIFAILLVLFLAFLGLSVCVLGPVSLIGMQGVAPGEQPDPLAPAQLVSHALNAVMQIGWFMVLTSTIAVIYARLRGLREGVDAAALSRVFS